MTGKEGTPVATVVTELSLAVGLTDGYAGGRPRHPVSVSATNVDTAFVRTPSGYYTLCDLPSEPSVLEVVVTSAVYLPEARSIDRSSLDPASPLVTIDLVPGPAYPFGGVTVVRGRVEDAGEPVHGALVSFGQGDDQTRTDAAGAFALPITDVTREDVQTDDEGRRVFEPGGGTPTVEVVHPDDGRTTAVDLSLAVGRTTSAKIAF